MIHASHRRGWLAAGLLIFAVVALATPADADITVVKVRPEAAAPGDPVELTVGCGSCLSVSVVRGPLHPPAPFPVSLVPIADAPAPGARHASTGPPRKRPFLFLGRATPTFRERDLETMGAARLPTYRLRFRTPQTNPGRYVFVLYSGASLPGPRGLLRSGDQPAELLRVLPKQSEESDDGWTGWWVVLGAGLAALAIGLVLLLRRRSRRA